MYSIGTLFKSQKETMSDTSLKTVNAHKQFLRILKQLFTDANWNIIDYKEDYESPYSAVEASSTYASNDDIEQRQLFVSNPDSSLYFVFETGSDFSKDSFNIGVWTFPSYDSSKDIHQQDFSNTKTIIASNDSLEYFVCVDNFHLYGFLYINNQFSSNFYLGFIDQFESKANYPFCVISSTQYHTDGFFNNIPPASGDNYPYYMGDLATSSEYLRYYNGDVTDGLNYGCQNSYSWTDKSFYSPSYSFIAWGCYCPGWPNYPSTGDYGLGELYVMASGQSNSSCHTPYIIPKMVLPGKLNGVYKISGFNIYTKFVIQVGGTDVDIQDSSPASVKGYVDAIIQSGGRAFVVTNDLNRIGPQNYVAIEMK